MAGDTGSAWNVFFNGGYTYWSDSSYGFPLRLVRNEP